MLMARLFVLLESLVIYSRLENNFVYDFLIVLLLFTLAALYQLQNSAPFTSQSLYYPRFIFDSTSYSSLQNYVDLTMILHRIMNQMTSLHHNLSPFRCQKDEEKCFINKISSVDLKRR